MTGRARTSPGAPLAAAVAEIVAAEGLTRAARALGVSPEVATSVAARLPMRAGSIAAVALRADSLGLKAPDATRAALASMFSPSATSGAEVIRRLTTCNVDGSPVASGASA